MSNLRALKKAWFLNGAGGVCLFGFGLCCAIESGFLKHNGSQWFEWVLAGTLSLCIVVIGLVLLMKSSRIYLKMEILKER
ncbi:MAG: hypothetical protein AAFO99_10440 [Bacteroidota bacterium]